MVIKMQGSSTAAVDVAAIQSLRHHSEGMSEGPGAGIGLDSIFCHPFNLLPDIINGITGSLINIGPSFTQAFDIKRWLWLWSESNFKINLLGFPNIFHEFMQNEHEPSEAENNAAMDNNNHPEEHNPEHDPFNNDNNTHHDEYPNVDERLRNEAGHGAHQMEQAEHHNPHEQVRPMQTPTPHQRSNLHLMYMDH